MIRAHHRWALFWNDRQAIAVKILLLILCGITTAALEVPW